MLKRTIVTFFFIFIMIACENETDKSDDGQEKETLSGIYKTRSGMAISISEEYVEEASLSNITILSKGFENELEETLTDVDPLTKILTGDLDKDGFDEIYLVSVTSGSGGYGSIIGFASNKDKSLSEIFFPDIEDLGHVNQMYFNGYRGHDEFTIDGGFLVRTFPVYNDGDTNADPSGGQQTINYGLNRGESGWFLKIEDQEKPQ